VYILLWRRAFRLSSASKDDECQSFREYRDPQALLHVVGCSLAFTTMAFRVHEIIGHFLVTYQHDAQKTLEVTARARWLCFADACHQCLGATRLRPLVAPRRMALKPALAL
jgi:hypothetical protein